MISSRRSGWRFRVAEKPKKVMPGVCSRLLFLVSIATLKQGLRC